MELDLKELLRIIRGRWWLLLLVPLLAAVAAYAVTDRQEPTYETTVILRVFPNSGDDEALNFNAVVGTQSLVETFRRLIISRPMLTQVIDDLNLAESVPELQERVSSSSIQGTQLFEVTVHHTNPVLAAQIADRLASGFIEQVPQSGVGATMVEAAPIPADPVAPKPAVASLLALAAGVLVAIVLIALLEYLDESIRETSDMVAISGSPLLTTIGRVPPSMRRRRSPLIVRSAPRSASAEAISILRANVELAVRTHGTKTIMVSSPGQDEGRSMVAANLSVALSLAGLSTVLIDADFHEPSLHALLNVDNGRGLASLLPGASEPWEGVAYSNHDQKLRFIPSGSSSADASAALSVDRLRQRIAEVRDSADVVIVDTPPFLALSDAFVVAASVDSAILVCSVGRTRMQALKGTATTLSHSGVRILGVVMNDPLPSWHPRRWWRFPQTDVADLDPMTGSEREVEASSITAVHALQMKIVGENHKHDVNWGDPDAGVDEFENLERGFAP